MIPLLLALDLAGIAPRSLQKSAVVVARDGDASAVVDREAGLWLGEGRLSKVATLSVIPDGMALSEQGLALWSVRREGLWTESHVELRDRGGALRREATVQGPAQSATATEDGFAIGFPGEVLLIEPDRAREVPVPLLSVERLRARDGSLLVHSEDERAAVIDLERGCVTTTPEPTGALERWLEARARVVCDPGLPTARATVEAEEARNAAIRGAVAARLPSLLAGLGVLGRETVLALAPRPEQGRPRFTTISGAERIQAAKGSFGDEGAILLQDVDDDLEDWAKGVLAPACEARILLVPTSAHMAARMAEAAAARARAGDRCADQIAVMPVGRLSDELVGPTLRYVSAQGDLLARRTGPFGPAQVRLDIASLTPRGDPLTTLGQLPLYSPEWNIPTAKATEIVLDVDGSAVIAAGWELVRVDASGKRVARMTLPGPVERPSVRTNGTIDAVVGGQLAVIDLDKQIARYSEPAPPGSASPPVRETGRWAIDGGRVVHVGSDGKPTVISLPTPALEVAAAGSGAVVATAYGLFGLDADGKPTWKLPDTGAWVITRGVLIVGLSTGITGFRLPR